MKKIGKILLVCILFLGVVSFMKEDTIEAAVDDTFTAKIKNTTPEGVNQEIDCEFRITKEATADETGEVTLGVGDFADPGASAISKSTEGSIEIPNEVECNGKKYSVVAIGDEAFINCASIINTGLGNNTSVKTLEHGAYFGCASLTDTGLAVNTSVTSIGDAAFEDCTSLERTGLECNTKVESMDNYAFRGCTSLISTGLENNTKITELKKSVFGYCASLKSTGLESNTTVKELEENAFQVCTSLESTGLENNTSVEVINEGVFSECSKLTSTGLETNNTVKELGEFAFGLCTSLTTTGLSKNTSVQSIGDGAFAICANLTAFYFMNESIPTLGQYVFPNTTMLYYKKGLADSEIAKLNGVKKPYEVLSIEPISNSLQETYQVGEELKFAGVEFNITLGDTEVGDSVNCDFLIPYDDNKSDFTYTPITLVKGNNTITGKYQDVEFSFEIEIPILTYDVTVKNGTSPKTKYEEGETVTITANAPESGKTFKNWKVESGGVTLVDANKKSTTFVMPKSAVIVEAQYEAASVPPVVEEPEIIIGAGFTYQINRNRDMEVTCSGKLEDLVEVYVDGVILNKDHYTLRSGSTIITLKASYLNTLTVGKHTLKLQYKGDVSAETYFLIAGDGQEDTKTPSTGDRTMVGLWMMSMLCTGGYIVYRYKKKHGSIEEL